MPACSGPSSAPPVRAAQPASPPAEYRCREGQAGRASALGMMQSVLRAQAKAAGPTTPSTRRLAAPRASSRRTSSCAAPARCSSPAASKAEAGARGNIKGCAMAYQQLGEGDSLLRGREQFAPHPAGQRHPVQRGLAPGAGGVGIGACLQQQAHDLQVIGMRKIAVAAERPAAPEHHGGDQQPVALASPGGERVHAAADHLGIPAADREIQDRIGDLVSLRRSGRRHLRLESPPRPWSRGSTRAPAPLEQVDHRLVAQVIGLEQGLAAGIELRLDRRTPLQQQSERWHAALRAPPHAAARPR